MPRDRVLNSVVWLTGAVLRIIVPVGIYGFLIWFFLGSVGWQVALAVGLAVPVILIPLALVWYTNIWGTYEVIREGHERQQRRAELLKEAEAIIRRKIPVMPAGEAADFWANKTPCWEMSRCPTEIRNECPAYVNRALPCWEAEGTYSKLCLEGAQANGRNTTLCHTCPVYKKYGAGVPIQLELVGTAVNSRF